MNIETLSIRGMTCGGCVSAVTKALKSAEGVKEVDVSLEQGQARIAYDENRVSLANLRTVVQRAGYEVLAGDAKPARARGGCCG